MNADDAAQRSRILLERVRATILRTRTLIEQTRTAHQLRAPGEPDAPEAAEPPAPGRSG